MFTPVRPIALERHLKQGNLVKLGGCYSGVLGRHPVYRRLALATEPALVRLDDNQPLRRELETRLKKDDAAIYPLLDSAGLDPVDYNGRSFGLVDRATEGDQSVYNAAERQMLKLETGEHRLIMLGALGVAVPEKVVNLPPQLYAALITRMVKIAQDPTFSRTRAIELTAEPFDRIIPNEDGSQTFAVSLGQLENERELFRLEIGTVTIEPMADSRPGLWQRFLAFLKGSS